MTNNQPTSTLETLSNGDFEAETSIVPATTDREPVGSIAHWFAQLLSWRPSQPESPVGANARPNVVGHPISDVNRKITPAEKTAAVAPLSGPSGIAASFQQHSSEFEFVASAVPACAALFVLGSQVGNRRTVRLNADHPAYALMSGLLEAGEADSSSPTDLQQDCLAARSAIRLLIESWVLFEDELSGIRAQRASEIREDWGRVARRLLTNP